MGGVDVNHAKTRGGLKVTKLDQIVRLHCLSKSQGLIDFWVEFNLCCGCWLISFEKNATQSLNLNIKLRLKESFHWHIIWFDIEDKIWCSKYFLSFPLRIHSTNESLLNVLGFGSQFEVLTLGKSHRMFTAPWLAFWHLITEPWFLYVAKFGHDIYPKSLHTSNDFVFNLQSFRKHRGQHWRWGLCMMKTRSYNRGNLSIEKCQLFSSHYSSCKCTSYSGPSFVGLQFCKVCLLLFCTWFLKDKS